MELMSDIDHWQHKLFRIQSTFKFQLRPQNILMPSWELHRR